MILKCKILLTVLVHSLLISVSYGQQDENFNIYVLKRGYNAKTRDYISGNSVFKNIEILNPAMIDPKKQDVFDFETVELFLKKLYPKKTDKGLLFINIENRVYQDLKDFSIGSPRYNSAVKQFSKLISTIRNTRPSLKIGIYGLPYRTYYAYQRKWNDDQKLDPVLSLTDYLFPSLYLLYPYNQIGAKKQDEYIAVNLQTAFEYGDRLNKPVIPFVWYLIHPINKQHGGELINVNDMNRYVGFIKTFRSSSASRVKGIVWWEPGMDAFNKLARYPKDFRGTRETLDKNIIFREYTRTLLK